MNDEHAGSSPSRRILVVEDDIAVRGVLCEFLQMEGHDVRCAENGREAQAQLERSRPDIVFCDRRMPVMSGYELLEWIRSQHPEWTDLSFVFLTALSDRRDRYAVSVLAPDGYLTKPIDFTELRTMLAELPQAAAA